MENEKILDYYIFQQFFPDLYMRDALYLWNNTG